MLKKKERLIWIFLLVFVLAISFFNFRTPSVAEAQGTRNNGNDFYYYTRLFQHVFVTLQQNYVDEDKVTTKKLMYGAIKGMLEATEDPFTFMLDEKLTDSFTKEMAGKFGGLGISISKSSDGRILIVAPIEDTPAEKLGILPGDIISEIEGETTKGITTDEAVNKMRGKAGTKINITIVRAGVPEPIDYTITRAVIEIKSVKYGMIEDGLGYVRMTTFGDETSKDLHNALAELKEQGMEKIILDLRNNPGGRLDTAVDTVDEFLTDGKIVYTRGRSGEGNQDFYASKKGDTWTEGNMVVLVNRYSASSSEIVSGALQDHKRAKLLGETTFGKFSVQYVLPLDQKAKTSFKLTVAHYYTPNGRRLHGEGIKPDFVVVEEKLTSTDIIALTELRKGTQLAEHVKKFPNESSDKTEISKLRQSLIDNDNIIANEKLLERLLYNERNKSNYKELVDMRYDKQLLSAIEYLDTGKEPVQDVEEERDSFF